MSADVRSGAASDEPRREAEIALLDRWRTALILGDASEVERVVDASHRAHNEASALIGGGATVGWAAPPPHARQLDPSDEHAHPEAR